MTPPRSDDAEARPKSVHGIARILASFRYSFSGFRTAFRTEAAIREELVALVILVPISAALPVSTIEHLLLVLVLMLVILVEILNTAIETTVDRISFERHPLAGLAKDLGSAAVLTSILMMGLTWTVIVGPIVLRWLRR